jgi:hypothetical protein
MESCAQAWLADVKEMMAAGKEDGLAMALAQNMMESQRKDERIRTLEKELHHHRGHPHSHDGRDAASEAAPLKAPAREKAPVSTRAVPRAPMAARGGARERGGAK